MKLILIITLAFLSTSCAHRLKVPLPKLEDNSEKQAIQEFKKFKIERQQHKQMLFDHISIQDKVYTIESSKYLLDYINPHLYQKLYNDSWGKYIAWFSLVPLYFFGKKMIEEGGGLTNVSLSLISATGFFYGMSLELDKNNEIIDRYNQDLKIKLNIIDLPLSL